MAMDKIIKCAVFECKNNAEFNFPNDETLKQQWVRATRVDVKNHRCHLSKSSRICGDHFSSNDFVSYTKERWLKKTAVPSIFPWTRNSSAVATSEIHFDPTKASKTYSRPDPPIRFVEEYAYMYVEPIAAVTDPLQVENDDKELAAIVANQSQELVDCHTENRVELSMAPEESDMEVKIDVKEDPDGTLCKINNDQPVKYETSRRTKLLVNYETPEVNCGIGKHLSVAVMQFPTIDGNTNNTASPVTIKDEPKPSIDIKEEVTTEQDQVVEAESVLEDSTKNRLTFEEDNSDQGNDVEVFPPTNRVERTKPDDTRISFSCNNCNKMFFHQSKLISHLENSHSQHKGKKNSFTKQYSETTSNLKSNLVRPIRIYTKKRPFVCNICDEQFYLKQGLVAHMRTHTEERPFACSVCDEKFIQKPVLMIHMSTHTGEKIHACNVCNKQLSSNYNLTKHMRAHTGEKPYTCNACDKKFASRSNFVKHISINKTREKPYSCIVCDEKFCHMRSLGKHMRIHQRDKVS